MSAFLRILVARASGGMEARRLRMRYAEKTHEVHMHLAPESKSVLDMLFAGEAVTDGTVVLGPFDSATQALLQVLIDNYDQLDSSHGEQQAQNLLRFYTDAIKPHVEEVPARGDSQESRRSAGRAQKVSSALPIADFEMPPRWRLHELICRSIRGVVPFGEELVFPFDGKSMLLYGPNGSGKSSLLGAIVWVLTGLTLTDSPYEIKSASIHEITQEQTRGRKICDWPAICTLPDCENPESVVPDCMATLRLRSANGETSLDLRRTQEKGLEAQVNNQEWKACLDPSELGITSLDLQLSILAPTMFGRQVIESAPDSRKILSLMLGYDTLEDIGSLADNLGRNRTMVFNTLTEDIKNDRDKLQIKLKSLPDIAQKNDRMCRLVSALQRIPELSQDHIKRTCRRVANEIEKSRVSLAEVLGVTDRGSPVPTDLEDNLIKALAAR